MAERSIDDSLDPRRSVCHVIDLDHTTDAVWRLFADDEHVSRWLGAGASIELRPGGNVAGPDPASGRAKRGTVDRVEVGRSIELTWWDDDASGESRDASVVRFVLEATGTGTRLTVTETARVSPVTASAATSSAIGGLWAWRLAMLAVAATVTLQPAR